MRLKAFLVLNRTTFLSRFCISWPLALASSIRLPYGAVESAQHFRIWEVHCHLHSVPGDTPEERMTVLIQFADRVGIARLILSQGYAANLHPSPEQLRAENEHVIRAVRRFPVDIFTVEGVGGVARLAQQVALERILFGSNYPLFCFESALLKIQESALTEAQKGAIFERNVRVLLTPTARESDARKSP